MPAKQKVIGTKVNEETYRLFNWISGKTGVTVYNLLQTVIEAYVRYFSSETQITENIKRVISCFGRLSLSKKGFTLVDPNAKHWKFTRCVAFIGKEQRKGKFHKHEEAVLIRAPKEGEDDFVMNQNNDAILEAVLMSLDPDVIRNLQTVKEDNGLPSLLDALRFASSETANDETDIFKREIEELFSDNERAENGKNIHERTIYKRRNSRSLESFERVSTNDPDETTEEEGDVSEYHNDPEEESFETEDFNLQDIEESEDHGTDDYEEGFIEEDPDRLEYA